MAQDTTMTAEERATLDSMFQHDEFFQMLTERADTSYIELSAGISNGVFSLKNNSVNADQATTSKIYYTPSAAYIHKSGLGISVTGYLAMDEGSLHFFQYAISPSYNYSSKKINWSASYTRYIRGASTSFDINPYQNDLYGNIVFKKPWIRPAIGIGYTSGRIKEYFDSVITFLQPPRTITIRDTMITRISSFSLNLSLSHIWRFENLFSRNDEFDLQPSILLNGSNQKYVISHSGNLGARRPLVQKLLKTKYADKSMKQRFSLQSAAAMLAMSYGKGKFIAQPQIYLDYYLHDTQDKKLSAIYSFSISYAF